MAVYAIKDPNDETRNKLIFNSLKEGIARFGWGYYDEHDLKKIDDMSWDEINIKDKKEKTDIRQTWGKAGWLLNVQPGDYFVYINIPVYGECSVVQIKSKYYYSKDNLDGDFRHSLECIFIKSFNRNNEIALKLPFSALRPRQRYQRIYDEERFNEFLEKLQSTKNDTLKETENLISKQIENFTIEISPLLLDKVTHYFPQKRFEDFIMAILKERELTGEIIRSYVFRGWGVDQGCDIEFEYYNTVLSKKETVIMQLKAYSGNAFISDAIRNLEKYLTSGKKADQAIIMTTAIKIDQKDLEKAKEKFEDKYHIPLNILYGKSMLAWIFRFGSDIILRDDNIG